MKKVNISILVAMLFLFGCASPPTIVLLHQYELNIVDTDGIPIEGVKIDYEMQSGPDKSSNSYITKKDGKVSEIYSLTFPRGASSNTLYHSKLSYEASKIGYFPKRGSLSIYQPSDVVQQPPEKETVTLIEPIEYFNKEFASSLSDVELKTSILNLIDLIILQGLVTESVLEMHSVNLLSFT